MKRIVEDYEAKLAPPGGKGRGKGKVEWERYGDGNEELSTSLRKLDLPDAAVVEVQLDGVVLGEATIERGAGRLEFESENGDVVPKAVTGQTVRVVHGGAVLLEDVLEPD